MATPTGHAPPACPRTCRITGLLPCPGLGTALLRACASYGGVAWIVIDAAAMCAHVHFREDSALAAAMTGLNRETSALRAERVPNDTVRALSAQGARYSAGSGGVLFCGDAPTWDGGESGGFQHGPWAPLEPRTAAS